jgi:ethanolamine-phosphate cytidylyltransferase
MLLLTNAHHSTTAPTAVENGDESDDDNASQATNTTEKQLASRQSELTSRKSNFMTTSRIFRLFSAGVQAPKPSDKIIYLAGAWDMFHAGHCEVLEAAKKLGDYVIVGVHNDQVVNSLRGSNLPILNLNERVLSVLGCKVCM